MAAILVAVDDSEESTAALNHALDQFPDATLHLVHAVETSNFTLDLDSTITDEAEQQARAVLEAAETLAATHDGPVETVLRYGNAAREIVSYAEEHEVDQIVTGSRGQTGTARILLGSVAETVARRAECPVTIVR